MRLSVLTTKCGTVMYCLHCCCHCCCSCCGCPALVWAPDIVKLAQEGNLNAGGAFDWSIDNQGRACLRNSVLIKVTQGVMSYALPELFPKDSPKCRSTRLGLAPAQMAAASYAPGGDANEPVVFNAIPIPGRQKVTVPCTDFATCGTK